MNIVVRSQCIGEEVYCEHDTLLGTVHDFIESQEKGELLGMVVKTNHGYAKLSKAVLFHEEDLWHATCGNEVKHETLLHVDHWYVKKPVITQFAGKLGVIKDYAFDAETFTILQLMVVRRFFWIPMKKYLISRHSIVDVTKKHVVVEDAVKREQSTMTLDQRVLLSPEPGFMRETAQQPHS